MSNEMEQMDVESLSRFISIVQNFETMKAKAFFEQEKNQISILLKDKPGDIQRLVDELLHQYEYGLMVRLNEKYKNHLGNHYAAFREYVNDCWPGIAEDFEWEDAGCPIEE
jgi:hypothetical protein